MSGFKSAEERIKKYKAKYNPITIGAVVSDVNRIQIERYKVMTPILVEIESSVKEVLDRGGITGMLRVTYHDFARKLFATIRRNPESQWDTFKEGVLSYFVKAYRADRDLLESISKIVYTKTREWLDKMRGVEVGGTQL